MKIITLKAENIKRLVAVEISPTGNLVKITGKNGEGKSSVLHCLWWALSGTRSHQSEPIRRGADKAVIELNLGRITVTRRFRKTKTGKITTSLVVETAEGARFPSPQSMLNDLIDSLAFDPLEFSRMDTAKQYHALKDLVGLDFSEDESLIQKYMSDRKLENRQVKTFQGAAAAITVPEGTPNEKVSVQDLSKRMTDAVKHNQNVSNHNTELSRMRREIDRKESESAQLRARAKRLIRDAQSRDSESKAMEARYLAMGPPPEIIDEKKIQRQIDESGEINKNVDLRLQKEENEAKGKHHKEKSDWFTNAIKDAKDEILRKIEEADMPMEGLSLGNGVVMLNGFPFDQASDAERLRASIKIGMQANSRLRVMICRDGSLLDKKSLQLLAEMADESDYQIWIEIVDDSGVIGFVIEDGHLVRIPEAA